MLRKGSDTNGQVHFNFNYIESIANQGRIIRWENPMSVLSLKDKELCPFSVREA